MKDDSRTDSPLWVFAGEAVTEAEWYAMLDSRNLADRELRRISVMPASFP